MSSSRCASRSRYSIAYFLNCRFATGCNVGQAARLRTASIALRTIAILARAYLCVTLRAAQNYLSDFK